jgi:hypothetical protein
MQFGGYFLINGYIDDYIFDASRWIHLVCQKILHRALAKFGMCGFSPHLFSNRDHQKNLHGKSN